MKVIFINNYAMDWAWEHWKKKEYPGHHLWGATDLHKYGIDVEILRHEKYSLLKKIGNKIKILGDLDQQLRIFLREPNYELVYSGCELNAVGLAFLRAIGIFKKPVVTIMHRSFKKNLLNDIIINIFIKRYDKIFCLSSVIYCQLKDKFNIPEEKLAVLPLGMDLLFYQNKEGEGIDEEEEKNTGFILSAGKTGRDYNTVVKAFREIEYNLKIYCSTDSAPTISNLPSTIKIKFNESSSVLSYEELQAEHEKAYAVAIPLYIPPERADDVTLIGYTSLLESMAMGKAVVMTRNRQIDIDIEQEGIGLWVDHGDVKGWQEAITHLLENPQETKEMGKRGRRLCEEKYNLETFSSKLAQLLKSVVE